MSTLIPIDNAATVRKYLESDNQAIKSAISGITSTVQAAASQITQAILQNRRFLSDSTDYLDGVFVKTLEMSQTDEIDEISAIARELELYYSETVTQNAFPDIAEHYQDNAQKLEDWQQQLEQKEAELEKIIHMRVAEAEARAKIESTSSFGLFESALSKAEKVFDQNKITRFVCSTISRFQEEFENIRATRDVEHVTHLFQQTIEPFQIIKMVADKEGKLTKVITNSFTEDCYQDLFLFFFRYYNELMDIHEANQEIPSTADELARIFTKKRKGAEQIIAEMHRQK